MTVTVQQTANTNTFQFFVDRVNQIANAVSTVVVSTNSNTAAGNAAITGTFTSNAVFTPKITVGNSTVNTTILAANSVQAADGNFILNANGSWTKVASDYYGPIATTGTTTQVIDSWLMSRYRGAEYFLKISGTVVNAHQTTKLLTIHNNTAGFVTEYGTLSTNGTIGVFSGSVNATHYILSFTPTLANTTINYVRSSL